MTDFVTALRSGRVLLMDGAMGTELLRGESVRSIHRSYLDAGADVLLTNTFQANPTACACQTFDGNLHDRWHAAIGDAHLEHPRPHHVLADIGPIENLTTKIAADLLDECVNVDGVLLETWSSFDDLQLFADRSNLPLLVSFTFHRTSDLMTFPGASPESCAKIASQLGAIALGANCGKEIDMSDMVEIVKRFKAACNLPIFVRPNAGTPTKNERRYPRTPKTMAAGLLPLLEEGIAMIGGCCGTTPEHIRRFREVIDGWRS